MDENSERELTQKFMMFEQQIRLIQEQLQAVEQAIFELGNLNTGLDELIGKTNSEIMAPIGRGIYAKAKLISEELLVDVGNKNLVKKSIPETKKILSEQLKKLNDIKGELEAEMDKINSELTEIFMEQQGNNSENNNSNNENHKCHCHDSEEGCNCGEDCECEEED